MDKGLLASVVRNGALKMKRKSVMIALLVATCSGVSCLSFAGAKVVGNGGASSATLYECDTTSYDQAKQAADQDAAQNCAEKVTRISDYTTSCERFAGGRFAFAQASAEYSCGN
jgi:hypothetical protein